MNQEWDIRLGYVVIPSSDPRMDAENFQDLFSRNVYVVQARQFQEKEEEYENVVTPNK